MSRADTRRAAAWSVRLLVMAGALAALAVTAAGTAEAQEATPTPSPASAPPMVGEVPPPGTIGLMAVGPEQTTRDALVSDLAALGCLANSVLITADGEWRIFNPVAPEFVNLTFPVILPAGQTFAVRSDERSMDAVAEPSGLPSGENTIPAPSTTTPPPFGVQHVIFGRTQLDLLTTGEWSPYVHDERDAFMLMSGNVTGTINCTLLNRQAEELRTYYTTAPLYAATSGIRNVREGVGCLDPSLFTGLIMVYEPNQPNATEFTWDQAATERTITELALLARAHGLESWTKISGRAAAGRDKFGDWDYGVFGSVLDGQIIQTQGSCRDLDEDGDYVGGAREFADAIESIRTMYDAQGVTSYVFARVTASTVDANRNAVSAEAAMQCAAAAWGLPGIDRVTLRTGVDDASISAGTEFLALREQLLP